MICIMDDVTRMMMNDMIKITSARFSLYNSVILPSLKSDLNDVDFYE